MAVAVLNTPRRPLKNRRLIAAGYLPVGLAGALDIESGLSVDSCPREFSSHPAFVCTAGEY